MGWTYHDRPLTPQQIKAEIRAICTGPDHHPLVISRGGSVFYAAVRFTSPSRFPDFTPDPETGTVTIGVVILTSNGSRQGFGYKVMDELAGPHYFTAPKKILALLSPTKHPYALKWRQGVLDWHARPRPQSLKPGTRIRTRTPLRFAFLNSECDLFEVTTTPAGRRCYRTVGLPCDFLCRITSGQLARTGFEVIAS